MQTIKTTDMFDRWLTSLNDIDRASVLVALLILREKGLGLSRPYADTIRGSRYNDMKELRAQSRGDPIRAFFTFGPARTGIVFYTENKVGNEKRLYREMLTVTDREFIN